MNLSRNLLLAYQSFGVVYGDLSTSPLYVFRSTFIGKLQTHENDDAIFGVFSLIFWTITLIPLLKYVCIMLSADDNGEGVVKILFLVPSGILDILMEPLKNLMFIRWDICSLFTAL